MVDYLKIKNFYFLSFDNVSLFINALIKIVKYTVIFEDRRYNAKVKYFYQIFILNISLINFFKELTQNIIK